MKFERSYSNARNYKFAFGGDINRAFCQRAARTVLLHIVHCIPSFSFTQSVHSGRAAGRLRRRGIAT